MVATSNLPLPSQITFISLVQSTLLSLWLENKIIYVVVNFLSLVIFDFQI